MAKGERRRARRVRHGVESLESRVLLNAVVVTSTADDGSAGTLRMAVNNAQAGDVIQFDRTVFPAGSLTTITLTQGPLELKQPNLEILAYTFGTVQVNANGASRAFVVDPGCSAQLDSLEITGGSAESGGGGAVYNNGGTLTLSNNLITGNDAYEGGAVYSSGTLYMRANTIANNRANYGGAAYCAGGTFNVNTGTFSNNSATDGAGVYAAAGLSLTSATFSGNNAAGYGGAVDVESGATAALTSCTLSHNVATSGGGGVSNNSGTLTISNCVIDSNQSHLGGGVYTLQGNTAATNSTFSNNTAVNYGGGFDCDSGTTASATACTFNNNSAPNGGGILDYGITLSLLNDTIALNAATAGPGGGISNIRGNLTASNCTIAFNTSTQAGGGIYSPAALTINNSIVAQDTCANSTTPTDISGAASGSYNLVGDGSGGLSSANHNRLGSSSTLLSPNLYPLADYGGPTHTMLPHASSPAIDAGGNSLVPSGVTTDQRGTGFTRILNGTVDLGADEYGGPMVVSDQNASGAMTVGVTPAGGIQIILGSVESDYPPGVFPSLQITNGKSVGPVTVTGTVVPTTITGPGINPVIGGSPSTVIGNNGSVQGIRQPLTINYPCTIDDSADTTSRHAIVQPYGTYGQMLHGLAPADIMGGGIILLPAVSGNIVDTLDPNGSDLVAHTPAGGVATFNFPNRSPSRYLSDVTEDGAGSDVVNVDDSGNTAADGVTVAVSSATQISGLGGMIDVVAAALTLNLKCGSGGSTNSLDYYGPTGSVSINVDTGTGNDTTEVRGVPTGSTVNVNGNAGNDAVTVYASAGTINVSNTAGKDSLSINAAHTGIDNVTVDTFTPAGTSQVWQRIAGLAGGTISYNASQMTGPVNITNTGNFVDAWTILGTPDYPAPASGTSPAADINLSVACGVTIKGAGANATLDVNTAQSALTVDFTTGGIKPGVQIAAGGAGLSMRGTSANDPFAVSFGQITHGSTTLQFSNTTQYLTMNVGTFTVADLVPFYSYYPYFTVNGPGTTLVLPGNMTTWGQLNLNVNAGHVKLGPQAAGQVDNLSGMYATFSNGGQLDIADDEVNLYGGWVQPALKSGYNNGAWNGPGIISSTLAPGYGLADTYSNIIQKALIGDTNLDGSVNLKDFLTLTRNFGSGYSNWQYGDFNYDASVTLTDLMALTRNFGRTATTLAAAAGYASAPVIDQSPSNAASVDPSAARRPALATRRIAV